MNDKRTGTLFFINRSSNVDAVDFAILLKKDKIIFFVTKFITITIKRIDITINNEVIRLDKPEFKP